MQTLALCNSVKDQRQVAFNWVNASFKNKKSKIVHIYVILTS